MKNKVLDNLTGFTEYVINITPTSWEITQTKRTAAGINCTQWFDITQKSFTERFKVLKDEKE